MEHIVFEVPVPQILEELAAVVWFECDCPSAPDEGGNWKYFSARPHLRQERMQERFVEQVTGILVSQIKEVVAGGLQLLPRQLVQE